LNKNNLSHSIDRPLGFQDHICSIHHATIEEYVDQILEFQYGTWCSSMIDWMIEYQSKDRPNSHKFVWRFCRTDSNVGSQSHIDWSLEFSWNRVTSWIYSSLTQNRYITIQIPYFDPWISQPSKTMIVFKFSAWL
jgi:hypothetical protein